MLTRKHFIDIALILRNIKKKYSIEITEDLIVEFIDYFKRENPNFKEDVFIEMINKKEISEKVINKYQEIKGYKYNPKQDIFEIVLNKSE